MLDLEAEVEADRLIQIEMQENIDQISEYQAAGDDLEDFPMQSASRRNSLDQISSLTPRESESSEEKFSWMSSEF